jgi:hypothetical protein
MQQYLIHQLDVLLAEFQRLKDRVPDERWGQLPYEEIMHFVTRARAAIHRVAGRPSTYYDQCEEIMRAENKYWYKLPHLAGIARSLRADIEAGYLQSYTELIHNELFADFLQMSQYLLDQGYKDASAVIAGSWLEAHLRQLCEKTGVDTVTEEGSPKKADRLNAELAGANVYSKLDQKNVTAWLDLRNKAAHGHYDQYQKEQVALLLSGLRDFITRNPA